MAERKTDMPWLGMTSIPGFWLDAAEQETVIRLPAHRVRRFQPDPNVVYFLSVGIGDGTAILTVQHETGSPTWFVDEVPEILIGATPLETAKAVLDMLARNDVDWRCVSRWVNSWSQREADAIEQAFADLLEMPVSALRRHGFRLTRPRHEPWSAASGLRRLDHMLEFGQVMVSDRCQQLPTALRCFTDVAKEPAIVRVARHMVMAQIDSPFVCPKRREGGQQ